MNGRSILGLRIASNTTYVVIISVLVMLSVSAILGLPLLGFPHHTARAEDQPNLIVVLTDDMRYEDLEYMPQTRALLQANGTSFTNFIVTSPLCCPSRTSLLTGRYVHNHGVLTNDRPSGGFERFTQLGLDGITVNNSLQSAGYHTALLGKYLNGYTDDTTYRRDYVPKGWSTWFAAVGKQGYRGFGYRINDNGVIVHYPKTAENYLTDVLASKTLAELELARSRQQPAFLYVSLMQPHDPPIPAPRHERLFTELPLPTKLNINESDISDKPDFAQSRSLLTPAILSSETEKYRARLRSLQSIDDLVARLFTAASAPSSPRPTYIFFLSDNGYLLGEHRLYNGKRNPYEESIRVPLIVVGPIRSGVPMNQQVISKAVSMVDLAPTFLELAQAPADGEVDGRSLLPLISSTKGESATWRACTLTEYCREPQLPFEGKTHKTRHRKLRSGEPSFSVLHSAHHTYIEYDNNDKELYDLTADPYQLNNMIPKLNEQLMTPSVVEYSRVLAEFTKCRGESCRKIDSDPSCGD